MIPAPQDVSAESSLRSPDLYRLGPLHRLFSPLSIAAMLAQTLFSSLALFFIPYAVFHDSPLDYQTLAVTVSMADIFCVDAEVSPERCQCRCRNYNLEYRMKYN